MKRKSSASSVTRRDEPVSFHGPIYKALPTLYDVCELSGVSSATVSRVFSNATLVRAQTRKRVLAAARRLGYVPSHAGRALRSRRTQTIGAIFPEMAQHFYPDVLAGIDDAAAEAGFDVLASFVGRRRRRRELIDRLLGQGRVDALILVNLQSGNDWPATLLDRLPIVLIGRSISGSSLPVIGMDNIGGAHAMIEHLYEQGHRRLAVLTGPAGNYDSQQRLLGCQQAFQRLGLDADQQQLWKGEFTFASGIRAAREMLAARTRRPDAIFCLNDAMAIGMLGELRTAGLRVPGDVALAGFDDVHESAQLSLTSIATPTHQMGQLAARCAVQQMSQQARPASHRLPVRLVIRSSSGTGSERGRPVARPGPRAV